MIIPIRCFTCGKVLADKYEFYINEVAKLKNSKNDEAKARPSKIRETEAGPSKKENEAGPSKKIHEAGPSSKGKEKAGGAPSYKHFDEIMTGPILDKLELNRYCCRRMMLGTVDMMDFI